MNDSLMMNIKPWCGFCKRPVEKVAKLPKIGDHETYRAECHGMLKNLRIWGDELAAGLRFDGAESHAVANRNVGPFYFSVR